MWYGKLFQSKGAALLNDLSPYIFNFAGGTTNRCLVTEASFNLYK